MREEKEDAQFCHFGSGRMGGGWQKMSGLDKKCNVVVLTYCEYCVKVALRMGVLKDKIK